MYYNGDKVDITIRDIDDDLYRQAKSRAALLQTTIGRVVSLALERWLEEEASGRAKKSFVETLKPVRFGKGTEHASERVDEILYGGNL
jgi:post-segregation antitoxin (ccd killing protein)